MTVKFKLAIIAQVVEENIRIQSENMDTKMLEFCDLTLIRSLSHEHIYCMDCGQCKYCTVPHLCCCGKCGVRCDHQHEPIKRLCFMMQEIGHNHLKKSKLKLPARLVRIRNETA